MKKVVKLTLFILCLTLIFIVFAVFSYFLITKDTRLDLTKFEKSNFVLQVYSDSGNLIEEKSLKTAGKPVKIEELKDYTVKAFISVEDKRFYSHNGIDLKRIIGATLSNVKSLSFKEGASTITQQLIKNTHLTSEKTLKRKLKEIKLSLELEKRYDKNEIIEIYLNTIYFGKGAYGIENASKVYFNKSAKDLTINESAILAGIIKAPSKYSPTDDKSACFLRKNLVLKLMKENGYISESEYLKNIEKPVETANQKSNDYSDYINAVITEYESLNLLSPYNEKEIKIFTYLNEDLQSTLNSNTKYSSSQIVINSKNNGIIAYYGNNSKLKRCPASCVKPFLVYAPMINDGYIKQSSVIKDEPINYNGYSPKNYNDKYYGNVTVKTALSKSLNVPAVKLLNGYTIEKSNNYTKKMGINLDNENLSCALGSLTGGLTLKELCDAYSPFNNGGNYIKSSFIKSISASNVTIYRHNPKPINVFSEETSYIISDTLKESVNSGNSKKLRDLPYEICAKTGTNGSDKGNIDALSISYTTDSIVGVWVGNEDYSLMPNSVTGSNEPTIISREIYQNLYKYRYPNDFSAPSGVSKVKIDSEYLLNENVELLNDNGEEFCYFNGHEPTSKYENYLTPTITNPKIIVNNNKVSLKFNVKNADFIKITQTYNNCEKVVYNGKSIDEYTDFLSGYGLYSYKITAYFNGKTQTYVFNKINYKKTSPSILENDEWLNA